jgi:peptidyl-prolyl cis-trans isomerase B (cyclophilin B)
MRAPTTRVHRVLTVLLLAGPLIGVGIAPATLASPLGAPSPTTTCVYVPLPAPVGSTVFGPVKSVGTPPTSASTAAPVVMTLTTNRGVLKIDMHVAAAPCTVNSFRFLAGKHYFDGSHCHRLTTRGIFVLQCGDPSGTGGGNPGYVFPDENLAGATYPAGTVAMANAGPCTNGSQFFITYKDSSISPLYTPFGRVTGRGLATIRYIADGGSDNANGQGDGHPHRALILRRVTVGAR